MTVCMIGVLLVLGGALELAGIALVGWDVWDARRTLREMSDPDWNWRQPEESRARARARALVALMADVAASNTWRRAAGVGLFACGLILQTVANVAAL